TTGVAALTEASYVARQRLLCRTSPVGSSSTSPVRVRKTSVRLSPIVAATGDELLAGALGAFQTCLPVALFRAMMPPRPPTLWMRLSPSRIGEVVTPK